MGLCLRPSSLAGALALGCLLAGVFAASGCQHDINTAFPPGLEPLENNIVPDQPSGPYRELLTTQTADSDYIHVYGRGYVLADPGTVWRAAKNPQAMIATCTTNKQRVALGDEPQYEFSFSVAYEVDDIETVKWDEQYRYGTIEGTPDQPTLAMIKHQKIDGSSFINRAEGTIELTPAPGNPAVTDLSFIEHLDALGGNADTVRAGMQHTYDALVALAHGKPIPPCP